MNILFMGTPDFAVPSLRRLLEEGYKITAVVTQPDRPKGRKRVLTPPAVKTEALKHRIPVLQPIKLREPEAVSDIIRYKPDLIITAAYGQILPKSILEQPRYGCINVHASLLPKYRGGAPIQHAMMNGDAITGVTIMYMAEGLDTGDIISRVEVPIEQADTAGSLFDKLSLAGSDLLIDTLPELLAGKRKAIPQNHDEATYAPNLTRADEQIRWERRGIDICNQVRGLSPWPGAFTLWKGEVFKIWSCEPLPETEATRPASAIQPGTVLGTANRGLKVMTGEGAILLTRVQPAGRKAMDAGEFARGSAMPAGTKLGDIKE